MTSAIGYVSVSQSRVHGLICVRGRLWMSPQALRANTFAVIPSHKNYCINFITSMFWFVQRLKCESKKFALPHSIYTSELVWSAA